MFKELSLLFAGFPVAIILYNNYKYRKLTEKLKVEDSYNYECMFITSKNRTCASHIRRKNQCGQECSYKYLRHVLNLIKQAKETISICMYHLTLEEISTALIKAKNRGVKVRCISDIIMMECSSSKIMRLHKTGIPAKVQNTHQSLMHHKFMIIDADNPNNKQLMFGSLNHTIKGFLGNWDNTITTNNAQMIESYQEEFDRMWETFKFVC
ncbi:PREDICTED: mitochondrial cardiolipin hydrolase [Nicrophorus vespilloides]|uniref:Mitochondrial cardiolipin hydrolase n=1 Tax=Nicrophorus vespilloides TaxID=110193 RepID=A0ABM1N0J7_NICVS|nr:PREDICTED: mitochondrial cardiolipin hydrolase [Nicrophorus vespilloides]